MDVKTAGRKGGLATAKKRTKKQRSAAARKAALARWSKKDCAVLSAYKKLGDNMDKIFDEVPGFQKVWNNK